MIQFYFADSERTFFSNSPYVPRVGEQVKLRLYDDSALYTVGVVEKIEYIYDTTSDMVVRILVQRIGEEHPLGAVAFQMIQQARTGNGLYETVPKWPN